MPFSNMPRVWPLRVWRFAGLSIPGRAINLMLRTICTGICVLCSIYSAVNFNVAVLKSLQETKTKIQCLFFKIMKRYQNHYNQYDNTIQHSIITQCRYNSLACGLSVSLWDWGWGRGPLKTIFKSDHFGLSVINHKFTCIKFPSKIIV